MNSNHKPGDMILGGLIGLAIGGILGILFAPRSGKETRQQIQDKYGEAKDRIQGAAEQLTKNAKQTYDETKEKTRRAVEAAKRELEA